MLIVKNKQAMDDYRKRASMAEAEAAISLASLAYKGEDSASAISPDEEIDDDLRPQLACANPNCCYFVAAESKFGGYCCEVVKDAESPSAMV